MSVRLKVAVIKCGYNITLNANNNNNNKNQNNIYIHTKMIKQHITISSYFLGKITIINNSKRLHCRIMTVAYT